MNSYERTLIESLETQVANLRHEIAVLQDSNNELSATLADCLSRREWIREE